MSRILASILLLSCLSRPSPALAVQAAEGNPQSLEQKADAVYKMTETTIEQLTKLRSRQIAKPRQFKKSEIQATKDLLELLKSGEKCSFSTLKHPFQVGDFGMMETSGTPYGRVWKVLQVIDKQTMLITQGDLNLMMQDVSTQGVADGESLQFDEVYEVVGTSSYQTVLGGKRTVMVMRFVDTDAIKAIVKKRRESESKDVGAKKGREATKKASRQP